jgi:hypothetical protein
MPKWVPVGLIGEWRKAKSSIYNGNCVEVADLPSGEIVLRDSKDPEGQGLAFTRAEWDAFLNVVRKL